jgi:spore coat protein CotH
MPNKVIELFLFLSCSLAAFHAAGAQDILTDAHLLDPAKVIEVRLEVDPEDWRELCNQSPNAMAAFSGLPIESPYSFFRATAWVEGIQIGSVGIRKKGFLGSSDQVRPSLKISFNRYEQNNVVKGLNGLTLNNNKQDRSLACQHLMYQLFNSAKCPAPRCNWAHLTVNGVDLGVYTNVESINKQFLQRAFGDDSGNLYEGTLTDFRSPVLGNFEIETNQEQHDLSDLEQLSALLAVDDPVIDLQKLDALIDVDAYLRYWCLEGLTGFWDGYNNNQNNFFIYFSPAHHKRGKFIPWGADAALTTQSPFSAWAAPSANLFHFQSVLACRMINHPEIPDRYRSVMSTLLTEVWSEELLLQELDRIQKLVEPLLHPTQRDASTAAKSLREFIRGRRKIVAKELDQWKVSIPDSPREPAQAVEIGQISGSITTEYRPKSSSAAEAHGGLNFQLDNQKVEIEDAKVSASDFQFPNFGGPPGQARTDTDQPILISIAVKRTTAEPLTVSLIVDRKLMEQSNGKSIAVSGNMTQGNRPGFGFPGMGGPMRTVTGKLKVQEAGIVAGAKIQAELELKIYETRGGVFQQFNRGNRR